MKPTTSKDKSVTTNPMEFALVHRNQTFALSRSFSRTIINDGEEPLAIHSRYSRIKAIIIGTDGTNVKGNIEPGEMAAIIKKSDFAIDKDLETRYFTESDENAPTSPAYTVKMTAGKFKGRTPAEVLAEDPANKNDLSNHYKWLKQNLEKYPKNKTVMEALSDACALFNNGELKTDSVKSSVCIPIYASGMRPDQYNPREDGMCFTFDIKISYYIGSDYPVSVEIQNYYAPIAKKQNGQLNVLASQMDRNTYKSVKMDLSMDEWLEVLYDTKTAMRLFEDQVGPACIRDAERIAREQAKAKEEQRAQQQSQQNMQAV